jgi:hypothetical protein
MPRSAPPLPPLPPYATTGITETVDATPFASYPGWTPPDPSQVDPSQQQQPQPQQTPVYLPPPPPPPPPRVKTIFLASRARMSGDSNDATYLLDANIRCGQDSGCRITVTPTFFSLPRSWDTVNASNNRFSIVVNGVESELFLQRGSGYNVSNFRSQLQTLIQTVVPDFQVRYDKISNKYVFLPPPDGRTYRILHPAEQTARFFGFDPQSTETRTFTSAEPLVSESGVSVAPQVTVVVSSDLMTGGVHDDFSHIDICNTGVLLVVPIDVPPFGELVYQAPTPDTGTQTLHADSVHSVRLRIGDESGSLIECDDYVIGLTFRMYSGTPDATN